MDSGILRDLYVSLGEPVGDGAWVVRVYHKPFIDWIWGGCFLMAIGGVIAVTDRRYRLARREQQQGARAAAPGARAPAAGQQA
jgi:cytochrome c-type biogenesis protein CcmF